MSDDLGVPVQRICVFCGANPGVRPSYAQAAADLGRSLARRRLGLVFGGGGVGLMGAIADGFLEEGGQPIGVIPFALVARELAHPRVADMRVVHSMHERKALMASLADGFVALPGGLGTLEELAEVLTWSQLGVHKKPCGLLNVEGYFDPLLEFFQHAEGEGFLQSRHRRLLLVESSGERLLDAMQTFRSESTDVWLSPSET